MREFFAIMMIPFLTLQMVFAKPLSPSDFAFNAPLSEPESNSKASLRQVALPVSVYENMQRSDYGDLRVFSADGQVVPHQIKQERSILGNNEVPLIFYPFSKEEAANPANIRVIIDQKAGQQRLDINQQTGGPRPPVSKEFQYIIENRIKSSGADSNRKIKLCKLKLDWEQSRPSMILPFSLEISDDLQSWKSIGAYLNVSNLSFSGSQLLRDEVDFPCITQKYLRLTWKKPEQHIQLKKISGLYAQGSVQKIQWKNLSKPIYDKDGNWLFESGVVAALSHMEFLAPQHGLLYKGTLYSRNDKNAPWKFRKNIIQYRLNLGDNGTHQELKSRPFVLTPSSDRYWKLQPENEGRLNENQLPLIRGGWYQQQLVFLAQGTAPFQLSYGNPRVKPANEFVLKQFLEGLDKTIIMPERVTLGSPIKTDNFKKGLKIPWKKIGLWTLLLLGTAVLGFMAFSLYRQMNEKK